VGVVGCTSDTMRTLQQQAQLTCERLGDVEGLTPVSPAPLN
jgi:hypothetical protein